MLWEKQRGIRRKWQRWPTLLYQNPKNQHFPADKPQQWQIKQRRTVGRHWEMERMRQSERRTRERKKEDFIYRIPENQKLVQPQWREDPRTESVRFHRVKLCSLANPFYFVSPSAVWETGFLPVDCSLQRWGWRYGCVGSGWLLRAFGGVTCAAHCGVDAQKRFAFI